jgi:SAM-dependent methyltransferase
MRDTEPGTRRFAPTVDAYQRSDVWGSEVAQRWLSFEAALDRALGPFGDAALERARVAPGERVLDVGCGTGATTVALARMVGSAGHVLGVDVAPALLQRAREHAAGWPQIELIEADAQTVVLAKDRDLVFSRFGIMFFQDATAAFRNLAGALRPGGRVTFVCWRGFEANPWQGLAFTAARQALPQVPALVLEGPGPHVFAESRTVHKVLGAAGLVDVSLEAVDQRVSLGSDLAEAVRFALHTGPTARALSTLEGEDRARAEAEVAAVLARHMDAAGVTLAAAAWVVSARLPTG